MTDDTRTRTGGRCLLLSLAAMANLAVADAPPLQEVTVTTRATLLERSIEDIAASVTIIDAAQMQRELAAGLDDVVRYQPGLGMDSVERGGNQGFSIRGIGGNRVLMLIDGLRAADSYAAGPAAYGNDMFELSNLQRIEVIRGPASVLYGADAIGGAVLLHSKSAGDYLRAGEGQHLSLRSMAASDRDQYHLGATWARQDDASGQVVQIDQRAFSERRVRGPGSLNPQDSNRRSAMLRNEWSPGEQHRITITADGHREQVDSQLLTEHSAAVLDSVAEDDMRRLRMALNHEWSPESAWADRLSTRLAWQRSDGRQLSTQRRISHAFVNPQQPWTFAGTEALRRSDFRFNQQTTQLHVQAERASDGPFWPQEWAYGFSLERTDTERPRQRCDTTLDGGQHSCLIPAYPNATPEQFPNKTFPDTRTTRIGAFVQNELQLTPDLTLIPGLRLDRYQLDVRPDALFIGGNDVESLLGISVAAISEQKLSFNLGALYALSPGITLFAQFAQGFRPPNFDEANQAFLNPAHGYGIVPNGELSAEYSNGVDAGLRWSSPTLQMSLALYHNRYRDFIENVLIGREQGLMLFQDQNVGRARIMGSEWQANWRLGDSWQWRNSLAWARGDDRVRNQPLLSMDPLTLVSGLRFAGGDTWHIEGIATVAASQSRVADTLQVAGESWYRLDLLAGWAVTDKLQANLGVFNLSDEQYAPWRSIRGLRQSDTEAIQRAQATGINARVMLSYNF